MRKILSKQQFLVKFAGSLGCDWDNLLNAWNALYEFLNPILQYQALDLHCSNTYRALRDISNSPGFPTEQVSTLKLNEIQVYDMMRCVCYSIANNDSGNDQFRTLSLPITRLKDDSVPDYYLQNIPSEPDHEPEQLESKATTLPKDQCLLRLSSSQNRDCGSLLSAWNSLEEFIRPRLDRRVSKQPSDERLEKWRHKRKYPFEQILALNLSIDEVNVFMRSVCSHISTPVLDLVPKSSEAPQPPIKRPRGNDETDRDVQIIALPETIHKRARTIQQKHTLPVNTKIYFMEEGNYKSRTGILVTLLSYAKPVNEHLDINTLRYGNVIRHLANRSKFEKDKHRLFYYDLENRNVRINVDTVATLRAAVEEMFKFRTSKPRIEFYFRLKEGGVSFV